MMPLTEQPHGQSRDFSSDYERDFDDLIFLRRAGHMGHHEYVNSSMPLWTKFIEEHLDDYYIPRNEIALIKKAGKLSASLLGNKSVTLVSRGCGTKFFEKEGSFAKCLMNVSGIVYLDRSLTAIDQSMKEGKELFPDAWHEGIQCNIYDPHLRYPVEGTEVGTIFGLTLMNIEGSPIAATPMGAYIENLSAIQAQMRSQSHFIATFDHNQSKKSIERAYEGQTEFAKDMLRRTGSIDPEYVDFVVKFHPENQILAHGYRFKDNIAVSGISGTKEFKSNDILWFNNSVKPKLNNIKQWNIKSGFDYVRMDIPMDANNYLGWHHLIKP